MTLALIDGDIAAYRAAVMAQDDIDWGDGEEGLSVDTRAAVTNALALVRTWTQKAAPDAKTVICLSCPQGRNFRKDVYPAYKSNRKGGKPEAYHAVVAAFEEAHKVVSFPSLEADDVMGIMMTSPNLNDPVAVTMDKDLRTVPGRLVNPIKDNKPKTIKPHDADLWWMTQTLIGDTTDGYPGCPGVGPARAAKVLEGCRSLRDMWQAVVEAFEKRGLTARDALVQARVARILRRDDFNKEEGTIRLWHPTSPAFVSLA